MTGRAVTIGELDSLFEVLYRSELPILSEHQFHCGSYFALNLSESTEKWAVCGAALSWQDDNAFPTLVVQKDGETIYKLQMGPMPKQKFIISLGPMQNGCEKPNARCVT